MAELLFGPAGVPHSATVETTIAGIERVAELGLGCMELEFVHGVRMSENKAVEVGKLAQKLGVRLSAHAPYFINLNAREAEKRKASQERLMQTARISHLCGARNIVFHAAYYMNSTEREAFQVVKEQLKEIAKRLKTEGNSVCLRPELAGRRSQFGTLEELIELSLEIAGVAPCIDFAHWHARSSGEFNSYDEFAAILHTLKTKLGKQVLEDMHIHVSGIAYGKHGEIKHLNLNDSDFNYRELIRALIDYQVGGMLISVSPNLEEDALLLQEPYQARKG